MDKSQTHSELKLVSGAAPAVGSGGREAQGGDRAAKSPAVMHRHSGKALRLPSRHGEVGGPEGARCPHTFLRFQHWSQRFQNKTTQWAVRRSLWLGVKPHLLRSTLGDLGRFHRAKVRAMGEGKRAAPFPNKKLLIFRSWNHEEQGHKDEPRRPREGLGSEWPLIT